MMKRVVLAAALCVALPASAFANGLLTRDLGAGGHYEDCLARALQTLQIYVDRTGGRNNDISSGDWSAFAFHLRPGPVDVQIACPYRSNMSDVVLMTIHSTGHRDDRQTVLNSLAEIWDSLEGGLPSGGTK